MDPHVELALENRLSKEGAHWSMRDRNIIYLWLVCLHVPQSITFWFPLLPLVNAFFLTDTLRTNHTTKFLFTRQ